MKIRFNILFSIFVILGSFSFSNIVFASVACNNLKNSTSVYYINGIRNTRDDANESLRLIKQAYKQKFKTMYPYDNIEYKVAYNETYKDHGNFFDWFNDDYELHRQKQIENNLYFKDMSFSDYYKRVEEWKQRENAFKNKQLCSNCDEYEYWYFYKQYHDITLSKQEIENRCAKPRPPKPDPDQTILKTFSKHLSLYQTDLNHGKRLILIPHSQGNLFANMALRKLTPKYSENIGMIGLGSVAGYRYPNTFYYTAYGDYAVNGFRLTFYKILPANIDNWDTRHSFAYGYFKDKKPSRKKVDEKMHYYLKTLQQPESLLQLGALMVTLTWQGNTDVDLHVLEPNNNKVFYKGKQGDYGKIDVDNTSGQGPEHYVVPCSINLEGQYYIGANYFSGSGAETVSVNISTENGDSKVFTKRLEIAQGASGNAQPVKIAKVKVYRDASGKYIYDIREDN